MKWQAPASRETECSVICKSGHLHPLVWPSEDTTQKKLHLYHLRSRAAFGVGFPSLPESVETSLGNPTFLSFCGLFDIHYPLILNDPFPSLPDSTLTLLSPTQILKVLKGLPSSPRQPTWRLQRQRVRVWLHAVSHSTRLS